MSLTDEIIKTCPHCQHQNSVNKFATWEKDAKRGLLGKTPEGFIMLLCPQCHGEIKYDPLGNAFLKPGQAAKSGTIFNLIFFGIIALVVYLLFKFIF